MQLSLCEAEAVITFNPAAVNIVFCHIGERVLQLTFFFFFYLLSIQREKPFVVHLVPCFSGF